MTNAGGGLTPYLLRKKEPYDVKFGIKNVK